MAADYLQSDFTNPDFSFVKDMDEESLNIFFDITDLGIEAMKSALEDDLKNKEVYIRGLSLVQNREMQVFYRELLEVYTDYDLYEECEDILFILDILKKYEPEIVANVN